MARQTDFAGRNLFAIGVPHPNGWWTVERLALLDSTFHFANGGRLDSAGSSKLAVAIPLALTPAAAVEEIRPARFEEQIMSANRFEQ